MLVSKQFLQEWHISKESKRVSRNHLFILHGMTQERSGGVARSGGRASRIDLLDSRVEILGSLEYALGSAPVHVYHHSLSMTIVLLLQTTAIQTSMNQCKIFDINQCYKNE